MQPGDPVHFPAVHIYFSESLLADVAGGEECLPHGGGGCPLPGQSEKTSKARCNGPSATAASVSVQLRVRDSASPRFAGIVTGFRVHSLPLIMQVCGQCLWLFQTLYQNYLKPRA